MICWVHVVGYFGVIDINVILVIILCIAVWIGWFGIWVQWIGLFVFIVCAYKCGWVQIFCYYGGLGWCFG